MVTRKIRMDELIAEATALIEVHFGNKYIENMPSLVCNMVSQNGYIKSVVTAQAEISTSSY